MLLLGLPSLGLTFAVTTLSAYLPSVLHDLADPIVIGVIIGVEGLFGLFMPVIFGALSDRSKHVKGRLKYLVAAVIAMCAGLIIMGIIHNLLLIALMVALFYVGYYAYLAPFWAIYPDIIPSSHSGRSRSAESIWRGIGAVAALVGSGFLISLWTPLPFLVAAGLLIATTLLLKPILGKRAQQPVESSRASIADSFKFIWGVLQKDHKIRNLLIANSLWNATLRSILAFTVLFFTLGMGRSHQFVAGVIFPIAAIGMVVMIPFAGKLADTVGHTKVMTIAGIVYGFGTMLAGISQQTWVIFCIPLVSGAAATLMVLPYSAMMRLLSNDQNGVGSGLFGLSRGVGSFVGPVLTGLAIKLCDGIFRSTNGYAAFWLVAGMYILISLYFVRRMGTI